jgi:mono/diheme cytochrome c family protein
MKKFLKIVLILIAITLIALLAGFFWINSSDIPSFENKAPDLNIEVDSARIAEGARMASMLCINCHRSEDRKLGGAYMADAPAFGEIYAPNISQHMESGIGNYTDGELVYLLRTGIKKDGQYAPPYMPKLPHLSDNDMENIVAFMKSDYPVVQATDQQQPESKPSFLTKFLCKVAFGPLPYPEKAIPDPDTTDLVAFGKYIATAKFECFSCHSYSFETMNVMEPEKSKGYFGGGNNMTDLEGNPVVSPNLTMDKETGIGNWTEEQFEVALRSGLKPDNSSYNYPMVPFTALTDREVSAVWAYLKSLPTINNPILKHN